MNAANGIVPRFLRALVLLGRFYEYMFSVFRLFLKRPLRIKRILFEIEVMGANSFPIIAMSSIALGMIIALQLDYLLRLFRVEILIGAAVGMGMSRELAPFITAIMLIARDGSAMTAEIGTMKVTEQLDAMRTMTVDPVHYIALPKIIASLISFPLLTAASNMMGLAGAFLVGTLALNVDHSGFLDQLARFLVPADIVQGLVKAVFFGFFVSVICTFFGFQTGRGSRAVGEATTQSVVAAVVTVFVLDYLLTVFMLNLFY